jgi:microcystin-dependent protein
MATLSVPYSFQTNTAIIASEMNSNFTAVKSFVEGISSGVNIDAGAIDSTKLATNTAELLTPTGSIVQYAGSVAPTGWFLCDGSTKSRTTYAALFAVVGTEYNTGGESAAEFRLPNFKGRVPVGYDASQTEFNDLGKSAGDKTVALIEANLPPHAHAIDHDHAQFNTSGSDGSHQHTSVPAPNFNANVDVNISSNVLGTTQPTSASVTAAALNSEHTHAINVPAFSGSSGNGAGTSTAHNNLQPYITINYIIKA